MGPFPVCHRCYPNQRVPGSAADAAALPRLLVALGSELSLHGREWRAASNANGVLCLGREPVLLAVLGQLIEARKTKRPSGEESGFLRAGFLAQHLINEEQLNLGGARHPIFKEPLNSPPSPLLCSRVFFPPAFCFACVTSSLRCWTPWCRQTRPRRPRASRWAGRPRCSTRSRCWSP